jgi:hypothetical protein
LGKFDPTAVVETPFSKPNAARAASVIEALLLYRDNLVKTCRVDSTIVLPTKPDKPTPSTFHLASRHPDWTHGLSGIELFPLKFMTPSEAQNFLKFWKDYEQAPKPAYVQAALYRYFLACRMDTTQRLYRMVEYVSALEALLLEDDRELSYKLAMRTSTIVAKSSEERKSLFQFMKKAYDIRSKVVHGTDPGKISKLIAIKVGKKEYRLEDVIGTLHTYSRIAINSVLNYMPKNPSLTKQGLVMKLDKSVAACSDWTTEVVDLET